MASVLLGAAASVNGGDTIQVTLPQSLGTNFGIVCIVAHETGGGSGGLSDDTGLNIYTQEDSFGISGTHFIQVFSSAPVVNPLTAGQKISFNCGSGQQGAFYAWAFNDCAAAPGDNMGSHNIEGRNGGSATVDNALQAGLTSNANDELFACILAANNTTFTPDGGQGWTAESPASVLSGNNGLASPLPIKLFGFRQTLSGAGSYALTGSLGASSLWEIVSGQYKFTPPSAGTPPFPPIKSTLVAVRRSALY